MLKFAKIAKIGTLILVSRETKAPMIKLLKSTARWPLDLSTKKDTFEKLKITNFSFSPVEQRSRNSSLGPQ